MLEIFRKRFLRNPCPCGAYILVRGDRLLTRYIIIREVEINAKKTNKAEKRERKYLGVFVFFVLSKDLQEMSSVENHSSKRHMHPNVHCSTIYNSQVMEATYMPIDRQMDKEDVVHTYNGILPSYKKE